MIYVRLDGRIGNQLFMYAFAKRLSVDLNDSKIIIDDTEVIKRGYRNSLMDYELRNVEYVHNHKFLFKKDMLKINIIFFLYRVLRKNLSFNKRYNMEKFLQPYLNRFGLILCENGYLDFDLEKLKKNKVVFINGYFQSSRYFNDIDEILYSEFIENLSNSIESYPDISKIRSNNTVCISIKVQHNVGNEMYDVCNDGYWINAINHMDKIVDNPLYFICSDNIDYVKNNLINCDKYNVIFQNPNYPVSISLAVMSECKHFIIGNTTFGWWAQHFGNYSKKIVLAPSRWMNIDMPIDIYETNWTLLEVENNE